MQRLVIANRGEVIRRVATSAAKLGIECIALYEPTSVDPAPLITPRVKRFSLGSFYKSTDISMDIYLDIDMWIALAKLVRADAIHPGWGFLSENAVFAEAVVDAGLLWIGPMPSTMRLMANKLKAKRLASKVQVPVIAGSDRSFVLPQDEQALLSFASTMPYPLLIKSLTAGGGRGMKVVESAKELIPKALLCSSEGKKYFADAGILVESFIASSRHIEVQILRDKHSGIKAFATREGTLQRRFQKVVEESPAPFLSESLQDILQKHACAIAQACDYHGAGTVEFLVYEGGLAFLEMNTRLQVEHPLTEMIYDVDIVEWQLKVALGEKLCPKLLHAFPRGHAIQARLCVEDPSRDFLPQSGEVLAFSYKAALQKTLAKNVNIRVDTALGSWGYISPLFDSLYAKVIVHAASREEAAENLRRFLAQCIFVGPKDNKAFLSHLLSSQDFLYSAIHSGFLRRHMKDLLAALQVQEKHIKKTAKELSSDNVLSLFLHSFASRFSSVQAMKVQEIFANHALLNQQPFYSTFTHLSLHILHSYTADGCFVLVCKKISKKISALDIRAVFAIVVFVEPKNHKQRYVVQEMQTGCYVELSFFANHAFFRSSTAERKIAKTKNLVIRGNSLELVSVDSPELGSVKNPELNTEKNFEFGGGAISSLSNKDTSYEASTRDSYILSPTTGKVTDVLVQRGDTVEVGTVVLNLESMKMEISVSSHKQGRVKSVLRESSQEVREGERLVELE